MFALSSTDPGPDLHSVPVLDSVSEPDLQLDVPAQRIRLRFAKRGDLRLISHHDLMRTVERMIRRAELPMASSQGFNPRPKLVFAMALGLGIEGRREAMDLELNAPMSPREVQRRLAEQAPEGLDFFEAAAIPPRDPQRPIALRYEAPIPADRQDQARSALRSFLESATWPHVRRRPDRPPIAIDLRPSVLEADLASSGELRLRLAVSDSGGSARPEEILDALGLRDLLAEGVVLARSDIELGLPARRSASPSPSPSPSSSSSSATATATDANASPAWLSSPSPDLDQPLVEPAPSPIH